MSGSARLISSQVINLVTVRGTTISVEWAQQTTAWNRTYCALTLQNEFAAVVKANEGQLPVGTAKVVMKESEHRSESDNRKHYTAFCIDKDGKDLETQHFVNRRTG